MKRAAPLWTMALTAMFAACSGPAPTAAEPPRLVSQPYFETVLVDWALAYQAELAEPLPFDLVTATHEEGVRMVEDGEATLLVSSGEPPQGWFATPLGPQAMTVIVHPDNPVRDLTLDELKDLYAGHSSSWESVGGRAVAAQPILPFAGEPIGDAFRTRVLEGVQPWPGTLLAPTPMTAVELVAEEEGAFGIVPLASITPEVRVVRIGGVLPGTSSLNAGTYPLAIELFAAAPQEPVSPLRDFLAWIQSR